MLPQIRLDAVTNIQATSFMMDSTIKFRGQPLKTDYGFCWSTRPNPTVRDARFNLQHRELYRGHATGLSPDTTYYVRAYANNGLGVRYSDEEQTVRTLPLTREQKKIDPLCVDSFSTNTYLYRRYSMEVESSSTQFIGYSPTCVLAKLLAYHKPPKFIAEAEEGGRPSPIQFDHLNWNPALDHYEPRLIETDRLFASIYGQVVGADYRATKPPKKFLGEFTKLSGARSKTVLSELSAGNLAQVKDLIRDDLIKSRPVVVIFYYHTDEVQEQPRWALIHGMDATGRFYVDFPMNSKLYLDGGEAPMKSGMYDLDALLLGNYKTHVISSIADFQ
jgi:hypothetical protein